MRFTCVPAQHFSGRGASDRDKTLWAGWAMQAIGEGEQQGAKIYFAGDVSVAVRLFDGDTDCRSRHLADWLSGRCKRNDRRAGRSAACLSSKSRRKAAVGTNDIDLFLQAFKEIGDNLGPFDLSLIPIGAYLPRYVMSAIQ